MRWFCGGCGRPVDGPAAVSKQTGGARAAARRTSDPWEARMRPIPVPDVALAERPTATRRVYSAPDGDLTSEKAAPVEVMVDRMDYGDEQVACLRIYLRPEDDDLYVLQRGGHVELTLAVTGLPMFATQVWGGALTPEQSAAAVDLGQDVAGTYARLAAEADVQTCPLHAELLAMCLDRLVAAGKITVTSTG